jgi:acyl-CoA thioester hydrolase
MTFTVRIGVRGYELDTQGRLNAAVYHQYGEHARWECLRAQGYDLASSDVEVPRTGWWRRLTELMQ